jgi:hypothetical protein
MALAAGLSGLSIPQIAHGPDLVKMLAPDSVTGQSSCCGSTISVASLKRPNDLVMQAAAAVASIKLHGRR